jgi:hypothetical protein
MEHRPLPRLPEGQLTHLPRAAAVTALVVAVAVAAAVLWLRAGGERRAGHGTGAAPAPATPQGAEPAPSPGAPARAGDAPSPSSARLPPRWRATVGAALDAAAAGRPLGEADRQELIDALARIRLTAGQRGRTRNPRAAAKHARLVRDADRLFRDKLGIGLGEFTARLGSSGNIEDLGAARP